MTIKWTPDAVWSTVLNFTKIDKELARRAYNLGKDVRDWKVELAQKDLIDIGLDKKRIVPILYRPFDIRYTYYTGKSRGFHCMPRPEVMQHMMQENLGLLTCRQQNKVGFYHALVCNNIVESCVVSNKTREINYLFPLYLYPKRNNPKKGSSGSVMMLFEPEADYNVKKPNLSPKLLEQLKMIFKKIPTPEQIFFYIYAVFYSNLYRSRYAEFLKIDFPRIPFTKNYKLFQKMSNLGKELTELHLLKSKALSNPISKFQGDGTNTVEKPKYNEKEKKVFINKNRYLKG